MKILSLWQLYASLCVWIGEDGLAEKQFETRSWSTPFRGLIAIHATVSFPDEARRLTATNPYFVEAMQRHGVESIEQLDFGKIIGTVELIDIFGTHKLTPGSRERAFGKWSPGRFAWKFQNPKKLPEPIPYKGVQGLRHLPEEIEREIVRQIGESEINIPNTQIPLFS